MSEKVTIKAERRELHLPAIALRGLVVFPNNLVHFEVGREKSIGQQLQCVPCGAEGNGAQ